MMASQNEVERVRKFNRFYTRQIGLLREGILDSPFPLTQARVLYEVAHRPGVRAVELMDELGLDRGYLSRMLAGFEKRGLVERSVAEKDRRVRRVKLTAKGRAEFGKLDSRSKAQVGEMLAGLSGPGRERLVAGMAEIEGLLAAPKNTGEAGAGPGAGPGFVVRTHGPGDIGWVVARHGELYAREQGWDVSFEGLVAEIAGRFLTKFDPKRERCWIAQDEDQRLGCVFLVRQSARVAKLRLLLVEPAARGMGVGSTLVKECLAFARECGYGKVVLWTQSHLSSAHKIYAAEGFKLVKEERHRSWGKEMVGQYWELGLRKGPR
jgi:DNA-binding MarR family transcriptional regulator/N-acetylglutamate synthase-like GNAT family acetyltransferase